MRDLQIHDPILKHELSFNRTNPKTSFYLLRWEWNLVTEVRRLHIKMPAQFTSCIHLEHTPDFMNARLIPSFVEIGAH